MKALVVYSSLTGNTKKIAEAMYEEINIEEIKSIKGVLSVYQNDNLVTINTSKNVNNLDKIINYFTRNEISIGDIGYREVTLETVFLTLTGRSLRE